MGKEDLYREELRTLEDWDDYLLRESRLPGPRANLELARAVADEGDEALFGRYLALDEEAAPTNSPYEFLAFCGVLGCGTLLAEGKLGLLPVLRRCASDPRWRIRESVAMGLQRWGAVDMDALIQEMERWRVGTLLEQRAAAAALCEPRLLQDAAHSERVLQILDAITASLLTVEDRRSPEFKALRKGLGYCWSVAVCASPDAGQQRMESWFATDDADVRWIMKQNLKKRRLARMDAGWVAKWQARL